MTPEAALLVATLCGGDHIAPSLMVRDAQVESGLRTDAVSPMNHDKTHDYGIVGINEKNFGLLNVDAASLIDRTPIVVSGYTVERGACVAFRAQGDLLRMLSRYNAGRPDSTAGQAYAQKVIAQSTVVKDAVTKVSTEPIKQPLDCPPAWDTFAHTDCLNRSTMENTNGR